MKNQQRKLPGTGSWATWLGLLLMVCAGCGGGEGEPDCGDLGYKDRYDGTMTGTMNGAAFQASVTVFGDTAQYGPVHYRGTFSSPAMSGESFHFAVDCNTGLLPNKDSNGFYENTSVERYARGEVEGELNPSGGIGIWFCTSECDGSGNWSLE